MAVFIYPSLDYIDDNDNSIDVTSMVFPREDWGVVTGWLTKQGCKFWVEKYDFGHIDEYIFKGYEHIYMLTNTVPEQVVKKYGVEGNADRINAFFGRIDIDDIPPTDEQIERHKNVWWDNEEYFVAYKEYLEFMKRQLPLPFPQEKKEDNTTHKTWKLRGRKVYVTTWTSGQYSGANIRIRWSEKLGLYLRGDLGTKEEAQRVAEKIRKKGIITLEHWKKVYYPGNGWETHCAAD